MITYGSVCSGIEAATVAWESLGWKPAWFSEIEPFPSKVLAHHYPKIPNLGDMTTIYEDEIFKEKSIDLLVGGTPCQSFSASGLRKGLTDPRGDLALEFLRIANIAKPKWLVWENVQGVLSSNKGRDFGAFLNSMGECGYGFAYRILNAQYFGVPQRRRRIFVIGYLGDWRPAAEVLFESNCLSRNPTENKEKSWQKIQNASRSIGGDKTQSKTLVVCNQIAATLKATGGGILGEQAENLLLQKNVGVRKLTPLESERLMGFPDNYTLIPNASDTKRYKALGNSMVIPVMRWIGERIQYVEDHPKKCIKNFRREHKIELAQRLEATEPGS